MPSDSLLDSQLLVRPEITSAHESNMVFGYDRTNLAHLVNEMLLYERIVIPTYDLGIIPILVGWVGLEAVLELLESQAISPMRRLGIPAYIGAGNAISTVLFQPGPSRSFTWWQDALFRETPIAVERQVNTQLKSLSKDQRTKLIDATVRHTIEPPHTNDEFIRHVAQETYKDVVETPYLRNQLQRIYEIPSTGLDLLRLPDVGPDKVHLLLSTDVPADTGPGVLLRVADLNLQLMHCSHMGGADLGSEEGAREILRNKLVRAGYKYDVSEQFATVLELSSVPDPGALVATGDIGFREFLRFRDSANAVGFRKWLRGVVLETDKNIAREIISSLREVPASARWPAKLVRLGITTAFGALGSLSGLASGTVDSLFVSMWVDGFSPKLLLNDLSHIAENTCD